MPAPSQFRGCPVCDNDGFGLALKRLVSTEPNSSLSTSMFVACYYGGCGGIRTPETCGKHVCADYKSGPINHSGTHPHLGALVGQESSQAESWRVVDHTTTHAERLARESQHASLFLNSSSRVGHRYAPRALDSIFSCIAFPFFSGRIKRLPPRRVSRHARRLFYPF